MKKHLKRLLSMMMAVLLCFGIFPSSAFAKEYEYDGYISMIDHKSRGYSLSSNLPAPFGGYSSDKFTELRINDLINFPAHGSHPPAWFRFSHCSRCI